MTNPTSRTGSAGRFSSRTLLVLAVSAAAVLTSACSGPAEPNGSPAGTSVEASAQPTASESAKPTGSTLAATPTPAPTAQTAVKELVSNFPKTAVPLMKNAQIQVSSTEQSGAVSNAAVTASVIATSTDVLAYYTQVFTDQGFTAQPGDAVDGLPLKTFVRTGGQELATVSVIQEGDTATFTVGATLLAAAFK